MNHLQEQFNKYSHIYKETVNKSLGFCGLNLDFFTKGKADFLKYHLKEKEDLQILDVGCGIGTLHPLITENNWKLTGLDVSKDSIKIAKISNPNNTYIHSENDSLPFDNETFDVIIVACVMHHVSPLKWQNLATEVLRVSKKRGRIFIFEHNPLNPLTKLAVSRCPFDADAVLLRARKIKKIFNQTQQIKMSTSYLFFFPFQNLLFRKLDKWLSWLPLGAQYCSHGKKF